MHAPRLSEDELTVHFSMLDSNDEFHVFRASRADVESPFDAALLLDELVVADGNDTWASLPEDGLSIFFTRRRTKDNDAVETMAAHRLAIEAKFDTPKLVQAASELLVYSPDGSKSFFGVRIGETQIDLLESTEGSSARVFPEATSRDLPFWFERRTSTLWLARDDVMMSSRFDAGAWSAPEPLDGVQAVTWVSPDGCRLYGHTELGAAAKMGMRRRIRPD